MTGTVAKELYDDIVFDYAAVKTNIFKSKYEETEFWKVIGDVTGQEVLDLACGSGYYTRQFKQKGASVVIGVDISGEMIAEAQNCESEEELGIKYYVEDASKYIYDPGFDTVTAQYLFCYAESKQKLSNFCKSVYRNTKTGGRIVTVTTVLDDACNLEDMRLGYKFIPCLDGNATDTLNDGTKVDITLYSEDKKSKCCFPNFLWKPETISTLLYSSGFTSVKVLPVFNGVPVMIIVATRGA